MVYALDTIKLVFIGEDQASFRFSFFITLMDSRPVKLEFKILWDKALSIDTPSEPIFDSQLNSGRMYFEVLHQLKSPGPTSLPPGNHQLLLMINGEKACLTDFSSKIAV